MSDEPFKITLVPAPDAGEPPVAAASRVISDYVAISYECMAQIEMAKRRLAEVKRQMPLALQLIADRLTVAERNEVIADFYWDAVELPSEPILLAFGLRNIQQIKGMRRGLTGTLCQDCGKEVTVKFRTYLKQTHCDDCIKTAEQARERDHKQQWSLAQRARDERLSTLRSMRYADYLRSPEWQQTRASALKRSRYRCQLCSANQWVTLDVHHNTYERRGAELPADVIVLCRECHTTHHAQLPEPYQTGARS